MRCNVVSNAIYITDCVHSVDLDNYRMDLEVSLPYLRLASVYQIDGKILVLPITGSGDTWSKYSTYNLGYSTLLLKLHGLNGTAHRGYS